MTKLNGDNPCKTYGRLSHPCFYVSITIWLDQSDLKGCIVDICCIFFSCLATSSLAEYQKQKKERFMVSLVCGSSYHLTVDTSTQQYYYHPYFPLDYYYNCYYRQLAFYYVD